METATAVWQKIILATTVHYEEIPILKCLKSNEKDRSDHLHVECGMSPVRK